MKLGTLRDGTRDGKLVVVRSDNAVFAPAENISGSLQSALDDWPKTAPLLKGLSEALNAGRVRGHPVDERDFSSPLPRAYEWIDGSAYLNHVTLVRKARGAELPPSWNDDPLVYQGGSGEFLGPTDSLVLHDPAWGLDFEAEVAVILGDTPQGTTQEAAAEHIRLFLLANDVSLRNLIPSELAKGFGFFQSKPATTFSPFAVTPDELGSAFRGGRLHRKLRTNYNGSQVGNVDAGAEMHFSFFDLVHHISKTRGFTAGTLLGSGTVSHSDRSQGVSCLAELRALEALEQGAPRTGFMQVGDTVAIEMLDDEGRSLFGRISQKVVGK